MIVDFDADTTIAAMERARWSYQLASITIGKLIVVLIARQVFRGTVDVETGVEEFKLVDIIVLGCRRLVGDRGRFQLLFSLIFNIVTNVRIRRLLFIRYRLIIC